MFTNITLKNFRAFKLQRFDFRRLNIFIGKNNSGKSSAISALNVLAQTAKEEELDSTPLILNGQFDELGTFIDVVNGGLARTPLGLEFAFGPFEIRLEYKYRTQRRQIEISKFELLDEGKSAYRYVNKKSGFDLYLGGRLYENVFPAIAKRRPKFRNFWPVVSGLPRGLIPTDREKLSDSDRELAYRYERVLNRARSMLNRSLDYFDSLSPFRDRPQRTYLYSGETARYIGNTGSNAAVMLASDSSRRGSERKELVRDVSRWFQATGIAQGLSVKTLTSRHFEISLQSNDGSEHNICDVGFGCSQVLPVLTAGLNLFARGAGSPIARKVLVVQEPEIHLHPNAQAALGSFFVDLTRSRGQIFIETHSDNLVLRVARHVVLGDIDPEDVAIFYVSDTGKNRVQPVSIQPDGTFSPEFPEGFFPQRQIESLELARAAMRQRVARPQQFDFLYPEER